MWRSTAASPRRRPAASGRAGRPVDRGKQGPKRSTVTDGTGVPLRVRSPRAPTGTTVRCSRPTLAGLDALRPLPDGIAAHLDRGSDSAATRDRLAALAITGVIARKGLAAPLQAGMRWVVERTHSWMNGYGKLRRCTERSGRVVDFYLFLAAAFVVARCLIRAGANPLPVGASAHDPAAHTDHPYCRSL